MTSQIHSRQKLVPVALLLAGLTMLAALLVSPVPGLHGAPSASAQLLEGPGYQIPHATRLSMVGAYRAPDGSLAYCLEWGQEPPTLPSDPAHQGVVVTEYAGWSPEEVARVNWLIGTHGQNVTNDQAASVGVAIWLRHPGEGDPFRVDHPFFLAAIPDPVTRNKVVADAHWLSQLMEGYRYEALQPAGTLHIEPDADDALRGEVVLSGLPARATGTLTINGALIGGERSGGVGSQEAYVERDARVPYQLTPSDDSLALASVSAAVNLMLPGGAAGPALMVWQSAPELQDVAAVGPVETDLTWRLDAEGAHDLTFSPRLTTQVPRLVIGAGDPLADTFRLELAPGSAPWRRLVAGTALPLTVVCRAYGPFGAPPETSDEVPADSPPAVDEIRFQVGGELSDPLASSVDFNYAYVPEGGGYYTSVCGIDAADQDDPRSAQALPDGYRFADAFGLAAETQFAPVSVRFDTTLTQTQVRPGAEIIDVIVGEAASGPWATWGDAYVAVPLVGTVYHSETRPVRSAEPPAGSEEVAKLSAELTAPESRVEAAIQLPDRPGWYTVRWCVDPEATASEATGEAPLVREWCDDYGVPAETVFAATPAPLPATGAGADQQLMLFGVVVLTSIAGLCLGGARFVRRGRSAKCAVSG